MLNINPDTVCELINLAREFHTQEQVVIPETEGGPSGDWAAQMLANHAGDMTVPVFSSIVNDLEPDQQHELVALFWLGREDFTLEEWEQAIEQARDSWAANTASYLLAHPMLADHLTEGLDLHGYSCNE